MIEELEKQFAWQNINTSEEKNKILKGKAIAIENEKVKLTNKDGNMQEYNINCVIVCQHIAGLMSLYPNDVWQGLIGNCDMKIVMGVNDLMTAEYIAKSLRSNKCKK